jgi:hypothetical protein
VHHVDRADLEGDRGVDGDVEVVVREGRIGRVVVRRVLGSRVLVAPDPLLAVHLDRDRVGVALRRVDVACPLREDHAEDEEDQHADAEGTPDPALDAARPAGAAGSFGAGVTLAAAGGAQQGADGGEGEQQGRHDGDDVGDPRGLSLGRGGGVGSQQVGERSLRQDRARAERERSGPEDESWTAA